MSWYVPLWLTHGSLHISSVASLMCTTLLRFRLTDVNMLLLTLFMFLSRAAINPFGVGVIKNALQTVERVE